MYYIFIYLFKYKQYNSLSNYTFYFFDLSFKCFLLCQSKRSNLTKLNVQPYLFTGFRIMVVTAFKSMRRFGQHGLQLGILLSEMGVISPHFGGWNVLFSFPGPHPLSSSWGPPLQPFPPYPPTPPHTYLFSSPWVIDT